MPRQTNNDELTEDLASGLKSTTALIQSLLGELRGNITSMAVFKEKLNTLSDNVNILNNIVRDGNGEDSLTMRMALVERELENLHKTIEEFKGFVKDDLAEERKSRDKVNTFNRSKFIGSVKVVIAVAPGIIALIMMALQLYLGTP